MASTLLKRARYAVGNSLRWASRSWRQWEISPDEATTVFACGFGSSGWHHLRKTLEQVEVKPDVDPRRTVLWRFLKEFCPTSVFALAGVETVAGTGPFTFPWGGFRPGEVLTKDPWSSRFCGPSTDDFILAELHRTRELLRTIKSDGYRPTAFPNSFIGGVWLLAEDGSRRFLVLQGNHRMAVLAHLGIPKIAVRALRGHHVFINAREAHSWPMVIAGACTVTDARQMFSMYFRESGWHIAQSLGLDQRVGRAAHSTCYEVDR